MAGKLTPCSQGARYYFRNVNGRQQKVVCPKYRWEQRQEQRTAETQFIAQRKQVHAQGDIAVTKSKLWKVAPYGAGGAIIAGAASALKMKAPAKLKRAVGLYKKMRTARNVVTEVGVEEARALSKRGVSVLSSGGNKVVYSAVRHIMPKSKFRAIGRILKGMSRKLL